MLTRKQQELLLLINKRLEEDGISPSFDEMKDALGLKSKSGIHRLIKALEERGFIRRLPNRARALEVLKLPDAVVGQPVGARVIEADFSRGRPTAAPSSNEVEIPMHGKIAAGTPIEAIENANSYVSIPPNLLGLGDHYALEVSGDSMVDLGILDGDTVIIQKCDTARPGEVIVALVDGEEATLKTLRRDGVNILLEPANRQYDTQVLDPSQVRVQGRLAGLLRQY